MSLEIREHIKLRGDDPLDATVAGTHFKAYLVANLALNDGPQACRQALLHTARKLCTARWPSTTTTKPQSMRRSAQAREIGEQLGARTVQSAIKEMKERLKAP